MSASTHVLYLALGESRVRATRAHVESLTAQGRDVVLVIADREEWNDLPENPRVRVIRASRNRKGAAWRAARGIITSRNGPLRHADLLVAGDAQALPAAWAALRRRPDLDFRLEPYAESGRPTEPADLAVVTPWYPSPNNPFAGAFVQAAVKAVAGDYERISVLHTEDWAGKADPALEDAIKITSDRLRDQHALIPVLDTPEGAVTRVPVPLTTRRRYANWAGAQTAALRRALPTGRIEAPVIHAHTGIYGGVLAMRLARPDARIVVTEHSSFLAKVFKQSASRKLYDQVLHRADEFLCVSTYLRDQIVQEFPHHVGKIRIVPNVINFEQFTPEAKPSEKLLKWLYLGRLIPTKGVSTLLEAFAEVAGSEPEATLTMVGTGSLREDLIARGHELGLGDRFRVLAPVPPEEVNKLMHQYDLLVHPSHFETFGMTVVEANAAGLPVLVTRSHGPEDSLEGIEELAGALMDVDEDPSIIVTAYWGLRERYSGLDLAKARATLVGKYSREVIGHQLVELYEGRAPAIEPAVEEVSRNAGPAVASGAKAASLPAKTGTSAVVADAVPGRVVLLAFTPARAQAIAEFANFLAARGVQIDLVTARKGTLARAALDSRVRLVDVEPAERRLVIPRGERFVVYRVPRAVLKRADRLAKKHQDKLAPELAVKAAKRAHSRMADGFHKKVFQPSYRTIRPRVFAKIAQRNALEQLELDQTDHVFVCDTNATLTGWRIARAHPHLNVTTHLSHALFEHLPVLDKP
ncbi:glycosyltransferase family 4 protein [Streptomyces sp. NBC_01433]|uniref:glycosyltransferase family 4 protein n=1 Tax=Streptomyces sp. NBC_01433 TaxID=2903864 RepID=UPI00224D70E2|nr:glycosyltransferase family 4 protein [Streptomyces sp. NBC_01433]MCX4677308.1 glycosyltransferase family 4 protein [Streptomyces sp. NBC_01433]